jgi:hypothetical protein
VRRRLHPIQEKYRHKLVDTRQKTGRTELASTCEACRLPEWRRNINCKDDCENYCYLGKEEIEYWPIDDTEYEASKVVTIQVYLTSKRRDLVCRKIFLDGPNKGMVMWITHSP